MDPYWSRVYCALRGNEFDAIARKTKKVAHQRQHSAKDMEYRPRTSWIPRSSSISALERAIIPGPIVRPPTISFTRASREAVLTAFVPHDKRFAYNPRASAKDTLDRMRYKPFPVANFSNQLARDNRPFTVAITPPSGEIINPEASIKLAITFNKLTSRDSTGDLFGNSPKKSYFCSPHPPVIISSKHMDRLSTCKRVTSPSFNGSMGRYKDGQRVPSFMQSVNNRTSLNSLCFEMLKANHYFNAKPSPVVSSCSPRRSFNRKVYSPQSRPSYYNYSAPQGNL